METKDKSELTRLKNKEREINYKIKQLIMEEQYVAQTDSFQTVERALTTAEEKKVSLLFELLHFDVV